MRNDAKNSSRVTAVILAAGAGRRLRPLTDHLPKCLIPVAGYPILHHQLSALKAHHITKIRIVVGYNEQLVRSYVMKEFPNLDVQFTHNPYFGSSGTLYSLALAAADIKSEGAILQINGDVLFDEGVIESLLKEDLNSNLVVVQSRKCSDEEIKFTLTDDGMVKELNKSISPDVARGEAIGINMFSPRGWLLLSVALERTRETHKEEYFEHAIERLIAWGVSFSPFDASAFPAIEIDTAEDLARAPRMFQWSK